MENNDLTMADIAALRTMVLLALRASKSERETVRLKGLLKRLG